MKQQEKTRITQERILDAALKEFGTKSYEAASINTICSASHLSKGLIYHNFKNKDDLYLQCVRICYDGLLKYLKRGELNYQDSLAGLQTLLAAAPGFFPGASAIQQYFLQYHPAASRSPSCPYP